MPRSPLCGLHHDQHACGLVQVAAAEGGGDPLQVTSPPFDVTLPPSSVKAGGVLNALVPYSCGRFQPAVWRSGVCDWVYFQEASAHTGVRVCL